MIRDYSAGNKADFLAIFDSNVPDYFDNSERDLFAGFLDDPGGRYFVIEQGGAVIGCGGFAREDQGQARFTWGMVDRKRHGQGLGRLLAEHRLAVIAEQGGFTGVELFTIPKVAPFFEKLGFVVTHLEKDGFAPGMDKVQMIRRLDHNG